MEEIISDVVTGAAAIGLALLGLVLAAHALDQGMQTFGFGLAIFGTLFAFGRIGAYYDRQADAEARAGAKAQSDAKALRHG